MHIHTGHRVSHPDAVTAGQVVSLTVNQRVPMLIREGYLYVVCGVV